MQTLLLKFGSMSGATIVKYWSPKVTHVIASIDEKGACTRTLKVLMAILNGKWIVKIDCKPRYTFNISFDVSVFMHKSYVFYLA